MELKSAWEISLEKAAELDGRKEAELSLSDGQKEEISKIRKEYDAKIAERDVMLQNKLKGQDHVMITEDVAHYINSMKEEFTREKRSLTEEMDAKIEAVRNRR